MRRPMAVAATILALTAPVLTGTALTDTAVADTNPPSSDGETYLENQEVAVAELDPAGLPIRTELLSRIASRGGPERIVEDPTSTTNIEYLNQRGRPDITGTGILVPVGGQDPTVLLTRALFDKPMPVALHAEYRMNGEVVEPDAVLGADGRLKVTYRVTNTDVQVQRIRYRDSSGTRHSRKLPVFAPFVGTLQSTLPADFEPLRTSGANLASDDQGRSVLTWNLLLYPPLGSFEQKVSFSADVSSGAVPAVALTAMAVPPGDDPAPSFSDELISEAVTGNERSTDALRTINDQTITLANAAAQLADGLADVSTGASQVSGGVNDELVPGARQLAAGAAELAAGQADLVVGIDLAEQASGQLAAGADGLVVGITALGDGLGLLAGGMPALVAATGALKDGADTLADAVGSAADPPLPTPTALPTPIPTPIPTPSGSPSFPTPAPTATATGSTTSAPSPSSNPTPTLVQAVDAALSGSELLRDSLVALHNDVLPLVGRIAAASTTSTTAADSATTARATLSGLLAALCAPPPTLTPAQCSQMQDAHDDARAAATGAAAVAAELTSIGAALDGQVQVAYLLAFGSDVLAKALDEIRDAVVALSTALRSGSTQPGQEGLVEGLDELQVGVAAATLAAEALDVGAAALDDGARALAGGTTDLTAGLADAESGADQLASVGGLVAGGAAANSFGVQAVASAITELASGTGQSVQGATLLADGATQLQSEGTARMLDEVIRSSDTPAKAQAMLAATTDRAATALPYGLPEGAEGSAVYVMTMAPVSADGSGSAWAFLAIGVVLIAGIAGSVLRQVSLSA